MHAATDDIKRYIHLLRLIQQSLKAGSDTHFLADELNNGLDVHGCPAD